MNAAPTAARCRELRLRQFRNFAELELELPPVGAAVIGDNGSGKTNLLEAVYYLEIFRSFRGAADEQLVRFGADAFHVRGRFDGGAGAETHEVAAAFEPRNRRKRVTIDGSEPDRLGDALGRVGAVVFSPSDVSIVAGAPAERRRFLDIVLSLNEPGYLPALQRFRQILRQRNAMLRDGAMPALLGAFDEGLCDAGGRIMAARAAWIAAHAPEFSRRYALIGGGPAACVRYAPAVPLAGRDAASADDAADAFRAELARVAPRERERGMTLAGPHRDDLAFLSRAGGAEVDLRLFGSGGQQRTAAIVLRMIEAETVRGRRGRDPMILMDDAFAELDAGRARRILELLEDTEHGQVLLTAPKASDLEPRGGALPRWRIRDGVVQP